MKKIFLSFIVLAFIFVGCEKEIKESKKESNIKSINYEQGIIGSDENPYNLEGEEFAISLLNLVELISEDYFSSYAVASAYIEENFIDSIEIDENILVQFEDYFTDLDINLENVIEFESQLINENNPENNNLLLAISYLKYGIDFIENAQPGSGFENCVDNCIKLKLKEVFDEGSPVEQAEFIIGCPFSFAWIVLHCTWICK